MNLFHQPASNRNPISENRVRFLDGGWIDYSPETDSLCYCDSIAHGIMYKILKAQNRDPKLTNRFIFEQLQNQDYSFIQ